MAQLNRYSFAGYYFNQPNVKVRQVTKGSPPLRGSNFIAPGRTGEIWTPKKHGGRMLTLEILVIDEPRGTARMIFDQIQQLAATRTQSALVNYLDSGPRTAQAEIVNWTAQDIDNVGLVFVGQLDFYLADPWFYGATVTSAATAITNVPTVGTPATNAFGTGYRTSYTLALPNVVSGQPIAIFHDSQGPGFADPTSFSDTFAGHYTYTKLVGSSASQYVSVWIATGGTGTTGVITVNCASTSVAGVAIPLVGSSVAAAGAAVDASGSTNGGPAPASPSLSLTATAAPEMALYALDAFYGAVPSGWTQAASLLYYTQPQFRVDTRLCAATGAALATWPVPWDFGGAAGMIVKGAAGSAIATLSMTNPGTVTAEKITLDILGPVLNPQVINSTTGTSVTFAGTVATGKHLLIDTGNFTALNGGANVISSVTHSGAAPFLTLAPGANALSVYGSVAAGAPTLTISFAAPYE